MDCVNHSGINAVCLLPELRQGLCRDCIVAGGMRHGSRGQILCKRVHHGLADVRQRLCRPPPPSGPNPAAAAVLGVIPGVGAMYNGQFFKGFIHVVVFAVLISITDHYPIFGLFIAAWILYQSFEAYHTAKALRDGQPPTRSLWIERGGQLAESGHADADSGPARRRANSGRTGAGGLSASGCGRAAAAVSQAPYQGPYQAPFPPMPPPTCWGNRAPVGAIVLIALGMLFLLGQLDVFHGRFMEFAWPLMLIALGVWLIVRRIEESQGGPK
jgi:hypothetical protein